MRDNRVLQLATSDAIAHQARNRPIFVFKTGNAKAVYIFGRRVWQNKDWHVDHQESFRDVYKRYHQRVKHILREPTELELANTLPAFHPLERKDGKPVTVGDYRDFAAQAWKAKQVTEIVLLIRQAEAQYIREDLDETNQQQPRQL